MNAPTPDLSSKLNVFANVLLAAAVILLVIRSVWG